MVLEPVVIPLKPVLRQVGVVMRPTIESYLLLGLYVEGVEVLVVVSNGLVVAQVFGGEGLGSRVVRLEPQLLHLSALHCLSQKSAQHFRF